jgi:hypothetical protein
MHTTGCGYLLLPPKCLRQVAVETGCDQSRGTHGLRTERQTYAETSRRKAWDGSAAMVHEYSAECVGCYAKGGHVTGEDPRRGAELKHFVYPGGMMMRGSLQHG